MNTTAPLSGSETGGLSRRAFLRASGLAMGGIAAAGALAACSPQENDGAKTASADEAKEASARLTEELPIPEAKAPSTTSYDCDVLVIGGGFAGLNAAMAAKGEGANVVLVDKGRPGYSGLSPWPSSHRWFDPDMGDDAEAFKSCMLSGTEYVGNADWYQAWIDDSKDAYERLSSWGILDQYTRAVDTPDYFENLDYVGYREANIEHDRHKKFMQTLEDNDIPVADYTMITDGVKDGDRVVGAVGFHVPSGTVITFNAKAVVMCMGGGCYKPTGYPVGDDTFDGEFIGYNLGLPIAGKEYDDFHMTTSFAPGNAFINNSWDWLENIWLCGGDVTAENAASYAAGKAKAMVLDRLTKATTGIANDDGTNIEDQSTADVTRRGGTASGNANDPRQGKMMSPKPKGDIYGAAVGMCAHLSSGVFCGLDDLEGATGVDGLYVAGDGMNASAVTGAMYPCGVGFTSNFTSIQGDRAGKAAAAYAGKAESASIPADKAGELTEAINAPLGREQGFSPNWARDQLQAIMAPYWINATKTEATLSGALDQVLYMRDNVVPKLMATNSHELRLCHEMEHKVLSAEMKLRAGLERKESRGFHYRSDYPFRDDDFLCYITLQKGDDGSMQVGRVEVKDEWKGDTTLDYAKRYTYRFPGEAEAKGLPAEEKSGGWGK